MPYSTIEDLYARDTEQSIIDLTDDEHTGNVDTDIVDKAISDADTLIDSYLLGRVSCMPFIEIPSTINGLSIELAIYYLYLRRFASNIPEGTVFRYKEAMKQLKSVASGEVIVCPVDATKPSVKVKAPAAVYTPETLAAY